jgi:hypothetical protein
MLFELGGARLTMPVPGCPFIEVTVGTLDPVNVLADLPAVVK